VSFIKKAALLQILLIAGCGYSFGIKLADNIETLEVPVFENATLIRGLEFEISKALAQELKMRTSTRLVTSGGEAVLSGTVTEYEKVPVYESAGVVLAGRIKLKVNFQLLINGGEEPVRDGTLTETQDFDVRTGVTEEEALRNTMREIARKIVYHIEAW